MGGRSLNSSGTFWGKKGLFGTGRLFGKLIGDYLVNRPGREGRGRHESSRGEGVANTCPSNPWPDDYVTN